MSDRKIMDAKPNWTYPDTKVTIPKKDEDYMPDQKWHRYVSFAKSAVRIAGFILLPFNVVSATIVLILSEIIGIVEELV